MREPSKSVAGPQNFDVAHLCRHFSELSPQPMIAVEGTTHIVRYLNAAFSRLVGKSQADLIGRPFAEAVPEGEQNGCRALLDRVYATRIPEVLEEQQHGQSPPVYWSYSVWAILGTDERSVGVMIQITDATEMAMFRRQVVAMNEQLLLSGTRQHELTESAERANQLKDEFLATLSHELRTPLGVIVGWAEMLRNLELDAETALRAVEVIHRNAQIQVHLIDDLLDVSRIITGKLHLKMQSIDLGTLINAAVENLRPAAEAKQIHLLLQFDSSAGNVLGDPVRLQQVVWNLLSNSIKFTPKGGRVFVRMARGESGVEVTVRDTGHGIEPEFLPHVFDRFRQGDATTTRAYGGLGLGLAIVRQLVELHGGTVRADSEGKGLGAAFTVSLQLIAQPDAGNDGESVQQLVPKLADIKGLRLLVVEDDADTRKLLQILLESRGVQVTMANSTAAALEAIALGAIAEEIFDVLISDIGMAGEDGYALITKVRALDRERGGMIPAAALTAYVSDQDHIRVLESGFQIHLTKPINPSELVAAVAGLAGRKG